MKKLKYSPEKIKKEEMVKDIEGENCFSKVIADCNTLFNGTTSRREKKLILTVKNLAKLTQENEKIPCESCETTFITENKLKMHTKAAHEEKFPCEKYDETFTTENELKVHTGEVHEENFSIQNIFHVHHEDY